MSLFAWGLRTVWTVSFCGASKLVAEQVWMQDLRHKQVQMCSNHLRISTDSTCTKIRWWNWLCGASQSQFDANWFRFPFQVHHQLNIFLCHVVQHMGALECCEQRFRSVRTEKGVLEAALFDTGIEVRIDLTCESRVWASLASQRSEHHLCRCLHPW